MSLKAYLPTPQKLSQEVIATLAAVIITALIVRQVPGLRELIRDTNP